MRFRVGPLGPPATAAAAAAAWQGRPQGTTRASLMEYFAVTPPGDLAFWNNMKLDTVSPNNRYVEIFLDTN